MKKEKEKRSELQPKKRKISSGPLRDKSRTMARLVDAVGKVIKKKGYPGLTAPNIALAAGVDKKLVWTYFGSVDNLIETFIRQKDFWSIAEKSVIKSIARDTEDINKEEVIALLQSQYKQFSKDKLLQKVMHWELGEDSSVLKEVSVEREKMRQTLLTKVDETFQGSDIDIQTLLALQIAGIYYMVLNANTNGSTFCGIDINSIEGEEKVTRSIEYLINLLYAQVGIGAK